MARPLSTVRRFKPRMSGSLRRCAVKAQLPEQSEAEFSLELASFAKLTGWLGYHTHDSRHSEPGFPDWVFVRERHLFAELKTNRGRLSKAQEVWIARLRNAGAEVHVWRPCDWDEVVDVLTRRSRG